MSDTPRTDKATWRCIGPYVEYDFSCTLERELAAMTKERDELSDRIEQLKKERDALRVEVKWLKHELDCGANNAERNCMELLVERDALRAKLDQHKGVISIREYINLAQLKGEGSIREYLDLRQPTHQEKETK